jgi:hypothetical protein
VLLFGGRVREALSLVKRARHLARTATPRLQAWLAAFHHDQADHDRARRRHDGLHAKAASTGFPEEADACRAKAEQLRSEYGLQETTDGSFL